MRLHNFFIEQTIGDQHHITIEGSDLLSQWRHVLRLNTGSSVILFDNSGFEYTAQFTELTYLKAELVILEKRKNMFAPKSEIFLFQSLIKPDKFEWILEKGTELGVSHFCPMTTQRTILKKFNVIRAGKIVRESSEQSGRGIAPTLSEPVSLEKALSDLPAPAVAFDPSGTSFHESKILNHESLVIFIGPEGGFTDQELAMFREKNIPILSLGTQILRAETAAVAVASLLLL
ncbi:MAG: RsmE family RNA methyltransferase [Patescibacteria group bacterium]